MFDKFYNYCDLAYLNLGMYHAPTSLLFMFKQLLLHTNFLQRLQGDLEVFEFTAATLILVVCDRTH